MAGILQTARAAIAAVFSRGPVGEPDPPRGQLAAQNRWSVRRWEAADTDRLNEAHWQDVTGNPINVDLVERLSITRDRCAREVANNPIVEGVITTYVIDLVGPEGPTLQVQSDSKEGDEADAAASKAYADWLEKIWADWWAAPCLDAMSGPELLGLWVRGLWTTGDILGQLLSDDTPRESTPLALRVKAIAARRLDTPIDHASDPATILGIELSPEGVPRKYWVRKPQRFGAYTINLFDAQALGPEAIVHAFLSDEPDQVRGYPWLASSLQVIADLRDYDAQVLDAARLAADMAVVLWTNHPDAQYFEANESHTIKRRTISNAPPGWQPTQINPTQPSTQYIDYRRERLSEIGRPVAMPLMMVRLDSSEHNYSSARFDAQIYLRALRRIRAWLASRVLNRLVAEVEREARLLPGAPKRPARVKYRWTWTDPPHVDPKKEAEAERLYLENGTLTYTDALTAHNTDLETAIKRRQRDNEALIAAGLAPIPSWTPKGGAADPAGDGQQTDDGSEEQAADKADDVPDDPAAAKAAKKQQAAKQAKKKEPTRA
ncbi:MAG: phage portal protein [Acidobacteria bacterium]|nr:phage portal protein [Acidobacteriota bacterium]